ncbi:MAG: four helix bundle protein, partial [Syntrophus sp. (in: bacteria)]|nr:four helix bundle protein [Syntrophus sp. (in: bacteria)]
LEIFKRKNWICETDFSFVKSEGIEIASMIKGLINAIMKEGS